MRICSLLLLVWAIAATLCLFKPTIEYSIDEISWARMQRMSSKKQKQFLMGRIVDESMMVSNFGMHKKKQINKYYERIVKIDSSDANALNSYAISCIELAVGEKDSLRSQLLKERSIWVAKRLRCIDPYNALNLIDAAKIYAQIGFYQNWYLDSATNTLSRINQLIEIDSVRIPQAVQSDKAVWIKELKETVLSWQSYAENAKTAKPSKYLF